MAMLTTPLCHLLGIKLPIISAPISAVSEFVAAVSNSGGLGVVQATWLEMEDLRKTIAEVRSRTDRPFGVNFVLSLTAAEGHAKLDAALAEGVPVVSTFWADPAPVIKRIHKAGAIALHTVGSAEEARRAVDLGVTVVAQGVETGASGASWDMVLTPLWSMVRTHVIAAAALPMDED
jgi:NAD(P)H-dependent flavin oxidoreductase YrpB (nitropropane dioxygenase family)